MQNATISLARDLAPPVKAAIESLLGRSLGDDEQVTVSAFRQHPVPEGEARQKAARRLERRLDLMATKVRDVSQDEMEAALNETLLEVRPKRE